MTLPCYSFIIAGFSVLGVVPTVFSDTTKIPEKLHRHFLGFWGCRYNNEFMLWVTHGPKLCITSGFLRCRLFSEYDWYDCRDSPGLGLTGLLDMSWKKSLPLLFDPLDPPKIKCYQNQQSIPTMGLFPIWGVFNIRRSGLICQCMATLGCIMYSLAGPSPSNYGIIGTY